MLLSELFMCHVLIEVLIHSVACLNSYIAWQLKCRHCFLRLDGQRVKCNNVTLSALWWY